MNRFSRAAFQTIFKQNPSVRFLHNKMAVNNIILPSNEAKMPMLGFGTWQSTEDELSTALNAALEAGYRHIDTAFVYENEQTIGHTLKKWMDSGKVKREDLFIVTKLPPPGNYPAGVSKYLNRSLENLGLDYIDLYLIHTPFSMVDMDKVVSLGDDGKILWNHDTDHVATWKEMEKQVDLGKAKAIGISNFNQSQIQRLLDNSRIKPANLQVEIHAYHQQKPLVEFCKENNITVTAYSPLGAPGINKFLEIFGKTVEVPNILTHPKIVEIAEKHGKSTAQVVLRHGIQKGLVVIPKSINPDRLKQNFGIFDFELDENDMETLGDLDLGGPGRLLDFTVFAGVEEHPEYPF